MRNTFLSLVCLIFLFGCSTNNGVTTVVPAAPTNLTGAAISGTQINLSWTDNATNEVGYKVQRKTTRENYIDIATTSADITSYEDNELSLNTTYNYRVYAFSDAGNSPAYSNEVTVPEIVKVVALPSVSICTQVWTTQNLTISNYRNGDVIPEVKDNAQWRNSTKGAWCWYNNDSANYWQYGKLYNWYAVNDARGFAPLGWHIPSDAEWKRLLKCLDPSEDTSTCNYHGNIYAGLAIKEEGTAHWKGPNTIATNTSGFTGLPSGYRLFEFSDLGELGLWWSSTSYGNDVSWYYGIYYQNESVFTNTYRKSTGLSVRLIRD